ncbi:sterol desaturase family protein [Sphingomonas lenta]|uniref:sterol desaturase family protein n=1 Tax=Sphingomonas lenta TaxID=1141887 RepID=UPI001C3ECB6A|nr:sterol desaturase family protein [Sphingomonas lenta]
MTVGGLKVSPTLLAGATLLGAAALAILVAERRRPLRDRTLPDRGRLPTNVALGAMSMAAMSAVEAPASRALARWCERNGVGVAQALPGPAWARDAVGFLLMDYTTYVWHVLTHEVPALWRLHLVHHVDLDLDASTALRFHAVDMLVSAPFRCAQVLVSGASPRALEVWRGWFFLAVLFHHSNLRLPERWDRLLALAVTTPRMHGIHHMAEPDRTGSNWSSGLSFWDRLHGTFRLDVPQRGQPIGVKAYREHLDVRPSLALPFSRQRDAWEPPPARNVGLGEEDHHARTAPAVPTQP